MSKEFDHLEWPRAWHLSVFKNRKRIEDAGGARCGHCLEEVEPDEVIYLEEQDGQETGQCPHCHVDCLIPNQFEFTRQRLQLFRLIYFESSVD